MIHELETVALRLFEQRGFREVTVEEIASAAHISARTFYRYFPNKEDVLQVQIDRRSNGLRAVLSTRPADEPPLHSLRLALTEQISAEDPKLLRRWIAIVAASPPVLNAVLGGIQVKMHRVIADFLGSRLGLPSNALVPTMLAAASGGIVQAAHIDWYLNGGDLATKISEGFEVLEQDRDDRAFGARLTATERAQLQAARDRIRELETDLRRVAELLQRHST